MNRPFSAREKALLIILALLLMACVYYILVEKPVSDTLLTASQRQSAAESELAIVSAQLENMHRMQAALDTLDQSAQADVPDYDNAKNVVNLLNKAMAMTDVYTLSFQPVTQEGSIVRRSIQMNFRCGGYRTGKRILQTLLDSDYRCRITAMSVSGDEGRDIRRENVTVNATVTFYEFVGKGEKEAP